MNLDPGSIAVGVAVALGAWKLWERAKPLPEAEKSLHESRIRKLEGAVKALELDWENVYEQLKRQVGRVTRTEAWDQGKGGNAGKAAVASSTIVPPVVLRRSDLLRRHNEQTSTAKG